MERNTRIRASQIQEILPSDINGINSSQDLYFIRKAVGQDKWEWVSGAGGVLNLSELNDVNFDTGTPVDDSLFRYESGESKWKADLLRSIDGTLSNNSDTRIPTEKAVKTYIDLLTTVDDFTIKRTNNELKVADRIEQNIFLNAFRISINGSMTEHDMVDGMRDVYTDESGIDIATGGSINQTYDSAGDFYEPTAIADVEIDYCEYANDNDASSAWESSDAGGGGLDTNVKLLLHCNGSDTSTSFPDESDSNHTITANGDAQVDTTIKKLGTGSVQFDGNDYLTVPDSDDWFLDGDFTIEFWVYIIALDGASIGSMIGQGNNADNNRWSIRYSSGLQLQMYNGASLVIAMSRSWSPSLSTWYHVAVTRDGNNFRMFIDGTQIGTTYVDSDTPGNGTDALNIGRCFGGSTYRYLNGHMDEIRISKGIARWTSNFTVQTEEYGLPGSLNVFSEATIKQQGSYSIKLIADITDSLNQYARNTFGTGNNKDLTTYDTIKFDVRASRIGTNFRLRVHDSGGSTITKDITIGTGEVDTWKTISWDISAETGINRDDIEWIDLYILNSDAENIIYLDNIYAFMGKENMTLISETFTADSEPSNARLVLWEEDVDSITIGTDIKAYISKDDGITWAEVTLVNEGNVENPKRILSGIVDLTQTGIGAGTDMRYRINTYNKDLRIHANGLAWA